MKDFHCHLLPGLDDGAQSLSDTEAMLKAAAAAGIDAIAATSHYSEAGESAYERAWEQVGPLAEKYGVQLLPGTEYDVAFLDSVPRSKLRPIGNSRYLLVDMNCNFIPPALPNLFFDLKLSGFQIIFAHPERMLPPRELKKLLKILEDNAIFIQVDSGSLVGRYGSLAHRNAFTVLDRGVCHFLWNDAHKAHHFLAEKCRDIVDTRYGTGVFELLTEENPAAMLNDGDIIPSPRRKTFWERLWHREC